MSPSLIEVSTDLEQISSLLNHVVSISDRIGSFGDGPHLLQIIQSNIRQITSISQKVIISISLLNSHLNPIYES
jgi:hypothetical protein